MIGRKSRDHIKCARDTNKRQSAFTYYRRLVLFTNNDAIEIGVGSSQCLHRSIFGAASQAEEVEGKIRRAAT